MGPSGGPRVKGNTSQGLKLPAGSGLPQWPPCQVRQRPGAPWFPSSNRGHTSLGVQTVRRVAGRPGLVTSPATRTSERSSLSGPRAPSAADRHPPRLGRTPRAGVSECILSAQKQKLSFQTIHVCSFSYLVIVFIACGIWSAIPFPFLLFTIYLFGFFLRSVLLVVCQFY